MLQQKRTEAGWVMVYQTKQAFWAHNGDYACPHAILTSGKHSAGFFNSRPVIEDEELLREAAFDLVEKYVKAGGKLFQIDGVAGPQTGATKLSQFIAECIEAETGRQCFSVSPAKGEAGGQKVMSFEEKECGLLPGRSVLMCEDVLTTGGSVALAETAIVDAGGKILPFILTLVNRSGEAEVNGKKIISLITNPMPTWDNEESCLLCQHGSRAIANVKVNWSELTVA